MGHLFISETLILRLGTDNNLAWNRGQVVSPYFDAQNVDRFTFQPAVYAELELTAIPRTQIIYGIRVDYHSFVDRWGVDPRVTARHELFPWTTLKGGMGLFNQPPEVYQADEEFVDPDLLLTKAVHYSLGIEQQIPSHESLSIDIEGFYKDVRHLINNEYYDFMSMDEDPQFLIEPDDEATVDIWGLEVLIRQQPTSRFFGWVSYTLMKSAQKDWSGDTAKPADFDQRHILNLVGCVSIGWEVDLSLRFRLVSGLPYTPIVGARYFANMNDFYSLYGEKNSARMPVFHQLDLRIDKKWQWDLVSLTVYLDVQNIYNRQNPILYRFNVDGTQRTSINDLPFFPSLGLRLAYR